MVSIVSRQNVILFKNPEDFIEQNVEKERMLLQVVWEEVAWQKKVVGMKQRKSKRHREHNQHWTQY
jgi:hypothetical protein